jgi:hypothetical protein
VTDDRALRLAVAAGEQVAKNPELAAAQRKAWTRFIKVVLAGGPRVPDRRANGADNVESR